LKSRLGHGSLERQSMRRLTFAQVCQKTVYGN
jgi:hypothetical protein